MLLHSHPLHPCAPLHSCTLAPLTRVHLMDTDQEGKGAKVKSFIIIKGARNAQGARVQEAA